MTGALPVFSCVSGGIDRSGTRLSVNPFTDPRMRPLIALLALMFAACSGCHESPMDLHKASGLEADPNATKPATSCPAPTLKIPAGFYVTRDGVWHTGPVDQYPARVDTLTWLPRVCFTVTGHDTTE